MKRMLPILTIFLMTACSNYVQQSTVPMDMHTVAEYNQRVTRGNTVDPNKLELWDLNPSDNKSKVIIQNHYPSIYPSMGLYYGRGRYYGSGVGLGSGFYY